VSWPEYPYSGVANDESHSLAHFTNDPWWKWFRNWKHLSNRARVLAHVRYRKIIVPFDAEGDDTTELVEVHLTCQPLDRVFVVFPYFHIEHLNAHMRREIHVNHNVETQHLDGGHSLTSLIDGFDLPRSSPMHFGSGGPITLGWPLAVGGAGWAPSAVEGHVGQPHVHVCHVNARGGDTAANGALSLAYRASYQTGNAHWNAPDHVINLRGIVVLGFRLADL